MGTKSALEVAQLVSQNVFSQNSVSNAIFEFCRAILIIKVSHLQLEDANLIFILFIFYLIRYLQSIKLIVHRLIYTSSVAHATFIRYVSQI